MLIMEKGEEQMFDLDGKIAVITGGASGIGLATAQRFHAAGAQVVIADIADGSAKAEDLDGLFVHTDVADESQVAALLDRAAQHYGRIDILVNNAGIAIGAGTISEQVYEDYRLQFDVNLMGAVFGIKHVVDHMPAGGAIVNTSSMAGVLGFPGFASYGASKWSMIGITKTAALELAPRGIRVNAVCPTGVATPMMDDDVAPEDEVAMIEMFQPINRLATADEVAAAIQFLVAGDCAMVTGHALHLDGGLFAGTSVQSLELALEAFRTRQR